MSNCILIVYQNAGTGREAEYNDWYTNVHIRDVMKLDGAVAVRRFHAHTLQPRIDGKAETPQHRYLAIYEFSDLDAAIEGHFEHARTERMPISTAGEFADNPTAYFYAPVDPTATVPQSEAIVTARFSVPPEQDAAFESWFAGSHRSHVARKPGIADTALFKIAPRQMSPAPSPLRYVSVYSLSDVKAGLGGLEEAFRGGPQTSLTLGAFEPLMARLTSASVRDPSPAERAVEDAARARLGDRVMPKATAQFKKS